MQSVIVFSMMLCIALGRPTQETDTSTSEYVHVNHISGDINRTKRSTRQDFPTNAVFEFEMSAGNVVLDLVRHEHSGTKLPIYILGENGIHLRNIQTKDNYAAYQDVANGASVLIKYAKDSTEYFDLFGEFIHNGSHYTIEPSTANHRIKRDDVISGHGRERHLVKRQLMEAFDFNSDAIYPPSGDLETFRPKGINVPMVHPVEEEAVSHVLTLERTGPGDTKRATSDSSKSFEHSERDRREADVLYIEYLIVSDYRNLQRWKDKVHGNTDTEKMDNAFKAMAEFYELIVNGIDLRFRTATGNGPEIRVVFANLLVSTMEETSPWVTNNNLGDNKVDDEGMLLDFAMWRNTVYQFLPRHDHAALFTGLDLATYTSSSPIGMAYLNSVCHNYWAVSEIEETYNAMTVHIAAHELGHNIGSRHDGSGNGCSSSALYLMAPRLPFIYKHESRSNPWTFSSCSQNSITTYLGGLYSDNCLTNKPDSVGLSEEKYDRNLVSLQYSPDTQCNMTYGNNAVLCRENLHTQWDSICYAMQCKVQGSSCGDRFFAFDGTPCGDKMWCKTGKCLYSEEAPSRHPSCLFGDDPSVACNVDLSCDDNDDRHREILCCGTCLGINRNTTTASTTPVKTSSELSSTTASSTTSIKPTSQLSSTKTSLTTSEPSTTSVKPTSDLPSTTKTSTTSDLPSSKVSSTSPVNPTSELSSTTMSLTTSNKPTSDISSTTTSSITSVKPTSDLSSTTTSSTTSAKLTSDLSSSTTSTTTSVKPTSDLSSTMVSSTTSVKSTPEPSSTTFSTTKSDPSSSTQFTTKTSSSTATTNSNPPTETTTSSVPSTTTPKTSSLEPTASSTIYTTLSSTSEPVKETTPDKRTYDPNTTLSFKLQSLVSLFVAAAIVI